MSVCLPPLSDDMAFDLGSFGLRPMSRLLKTPVLLDAPANDAAPEQGRFEIRSSCSFTSIGWLGPHFEKEGKIIVSCDLYLMI